jgi:hypothetical protein
MVNCSSSVSAVNGRTVYVPGLAAIAGLADLSTQMETFATCTRVRARHGVLYFRTEMSAHKHGVCFDDDRYTLPKNWTRML